MAIFLLAACAASQLPPGYESLRAEATLVEVSQYLAGLREGYKTAYRTGRLDASRFVLAVRADETLTVSWEILRQAMAARTDTAKMWVAVLDGLTRLEGIICAWVPDPVACRRPAALGVQ